MRKTYRQLLLVLAQGAVLLSLLGGSLSGLAQTSSNPGQTAPGMLEVPITTDIFSRNAKPPSWANWIDQLPAASPDQPIAFRLNDTQLYLDSELHRFVHRAIEINDNQALGSIGQYEIQFNPDYQRVRLHRLDDMKSRHSLPSMQTRVRLARDWGNNFL